MSLQKRTITDKMEILRVQDHFVLQVRESIQILENDIPISETYHRYVLNPNHDVSTISDATVLAQFNVVMTDEVKRSYHAFLEAQNAEMNPSDLEAQNAEMNPAE